MAIHEDSSSEVLLWHEDPNTRPILVSRHLLLKYNISIPDNK
jgi:hypothetical protein